MCVYLYECECLSVSMAELVFGLSCFSIDILWKNLSCPELLLSSFLCLSYVCCCCSCCSGWCGHYPVLCVCVFVSDWVTVRVYMWETTETQQLSLFVYAWLKTTAGFDLICQRSIRRLLWWCCFAVFYGCYGN